MRLEMGSVNGITELLGQLFDTISADDQHQPTRTLGTTLFGGRNDRGNSPGEDISHDTSPSVDDAARVEHPAQSASPGTSANGPRRSTRQRRPVDRYGLFPITYVTTLYACNVSAYVVRYVLVFVFINLCSQLSGVECPAIISL